MEGKITSPYPITLLPTKQDIDKCMYEMCGESSHLKERQIQHTTNEPMRRDFMDPQ